MYIESTSLSPLDRFPMNFKMELLHPKDSSKNVCCGGGFLVGAGGFPLTLYFCLLWGAESTHLFTNAEHDRGFRNFARLDLINNPVNGFLDPVTYTLSLRFSLEHQIATGAQEYDPPLSFCRCSIFVCNPLMFLLRVAGVPKLL